MSYFYNNKVYNLYQVSDNSYGSDTIEKDVIEIINNEKIIFDFTSLVVHAENAGILNFDDVETIKIHIDWGDGDIDRISKPLISDKSSIGIYRPNQWKIIEHLFNVSKRYKYETEDSNYFHKIIITAYNSFNDKLVIKIPYKVVYKTLYDLGSELSLFSSNTTNTNKVSYTLKQKSSDSMVVVMTKDWRTIYGDDDTEIIEEKLSEIFADDFIDEDDMIWDWKSVPTISLTVTPKETNNQIVGSFTETGIGIDKWEAYVVLPKDTGDKIIQTEKIPSSSEDDNTFNFATKKLKNQNGNEIQLENGIYAVSINPMLGINGVTGASDIKWVQYGTEKRPRTLIQQTSKNPIVVNAAANAKTITFNYTLETGQQLKNLTKANLLLSAEFKEESLRSQIIDDIKFSYNLLEPLFDKNGNPLYTKNGNNRNFSYTIKMRNIPNTAKYKNDSGTFEDKDIQYNVSIQTNDVLGGEDEVNFYGNDGDIYDFDPISFDYNIGSFSSVSIQNQNQISKEIEYKWKFTTEDTWDEFKIKLVHVDTSGDEPVETLIKQDVHSFTGGITFDGLNTQTSGSSLSFSKKFDGNTIPDGKFYIENEYCVHMNDYYDSRTVVSKTYKDSFTYLRPQLSLSDIRPFVVIDYDKIRNKQSLSLCAEVCSQYNAEPLKNISMSVNNGSEISLPSLNYIYNFPNTNSSTTSFVLKAANENDLYNRKGSVSGSFQVTNNLTNLLSLPNDGVDYFTDDTTKMFTNTETNEVVDWLWVKQNTLHDVNKSISYQNGKYIGSDDSGYFKYGTSVRHAVYEIVSLSDGSETIRRFKPFRGNTSNLGTKTNLVGVNDLIKDTTSAGYQKFTDKGVLSFNIIKKGSTDIFQNLPKIKNMFLKLYYDGVEIGKFDIKGKKEYTIENIDFGEYEYEIELNSEHNKTSSNTTTRKSVKVLIPPNDSVVFTGKPTETLNSAETKKYITWRWEVNHTSADEILFLYTAKKKDGATQTGRFNYAKNQKVFQSVELDSGDVIEYFFLVKSDSLNLEGAETMNDSGATYCVVNKSSYTIT